MAETTYAYFAQNGTISVSTAKNSRSSGETDHDFPVAAIQNFSVEGQFESNDLYGWGDVKRQASARHQSKVNVTFEYVKFLDALMFQKILYGGMNGFPSDIPAEGVGIGNTTNHYYFDFEARIPDSLGQKVLLIKITDIYFANVPLGGELGEWVKLNMSGTGYDMKTNVVALVIFDSNLDGGTGTVNYGTLLPGDTITLPSATDVTKTGSTLSNWEIYYNGSTTASATQPPSASITIPTGTTSMIIKALWGNAYTVTYIANGGSGVMPQATANGEFTLPKCSYTAPTGTTFKAWSVSIGGAEETEKAVGSTIDVTAATTAKAVWAYTITFNANGGTGTMNSVLVTQKAEYTLPASTFTAPSGKTFSKWSVTIGSGTATEMSAGAKITVTANTVVKALWA